MAAKETRSSEKTLKILSDLSQEHEMLILKRQALLQIQKHIEKETDLRKTNKQEDINIAKRRNKKIFDDLDAAQRLLKEASYSISENRLQTLQDQYFELIKNKFPDWLKDVEATVEP